MLESFYNYMGWENAEWSERQRHLKYLSCEQIKKSEIILKPLLVRNTSEDFVHAKYRNNRKRKKKKSKA